MNPSALIAGSAEACSVSRLLVVGAAESMDARGRLARVWVPARVRDRVLEMAGVPRPAGPEGIPGAAAIPSLGQARCAGPTDRMAVSPVALRAATAWSRWPWT